VRRAPRRLTPPPLRRSGPGRPKGKDDSGGVAHALKVASTAGLGVVLVAIVIGLVATSGSIVINDFHVADKVIDGLAGSQAAALLRDQVEEIVRVHRQASADADPFTLLSALPASPVPKVLLGDDITPQRPPVGLTLQPRATRSLDLKRLGDIKVGGFAVPVAMLWDVVRAITGWGPTTVTGYLAGEANRLSAVVEVSTDRSTTVERVEGSKEQGVRALLESTAIRIVYESAGRDLGLDRTSFVELTRGLRQLRQYETTLSQQSLLAAAAYFERALTTGLQGALAAYDRGVVAEITGNDALAIRLYEASLARKGDLLPAKLRRAVLVARQGDLTTARQEFERLVATDTPIGRVARIYLAEITELEGDARRALVHWRQTLATLLPTTADALAIVASVRERLERFERAAERLEQVVQSSLVVDLDSWGAVMLQVGRAYEDLGMQQRAASAYETVIAAEQHLSRETAVLARAKHGRSLFLMQRYRESLMTYEELARRESVAVEHLSENGRKAGAEDAALLVEYWLGRNAVGLRDPDTATRHLQKALRQRPDLLTIHFELATIAHDFQQSSRGAIAHLESVTKDRRTSARIHGMAHENIAVLRSDTGDYCGAVLALRDIVRPSTGKTTETMARRLGRFATYSLLASDRRQEAADYATTALLGDARSAHAMNALAVVSLRRGDFEGANRWAVRAWLHGDPRERGFALWITGRTSLASGDIHGAAQQFGWSGVLRPGDVLPRLWHAVALIRLQRTVEADSVLAEALRAAPERRDEIARAIHQIKARVETGLPGDEPTTPCLAERTSTDQRTRFVLTRGSSSDRPTPSRRAHE
jgi:tetratricopeptide (TPR) repeat protein